MTISQSKRGVEFLERLRSEVLICDGAVGTALYAMGYSHRTCFDELNETHPEAVESLHRDYVAAGAQIIETNTFGANPFRIADHGLEEKKTREINRLGAQIARKVAGDVIYVAGSIGPLDRVLQPIGTLTPSQAREAFRIQAQGLAEGGVDLFIIETISSLIEMREAIAAVRDVCDLPIVATMTFTEDAKTLVGDKPEQVRQALTEFGADVVGANCSVGPQAMLDVIERMRGGDLPLAAQPNAGNARVIGGRYIYLASPQYFAEYAVKLADAGVTLLGGCCGTTSEHIRAIADAVKGRQPGKRVSVSVGEIEEETRMEGPHWGLPFSDFRANLGKKFQVSVEIDPPRSVDPGPFIRHAQRLRAAGVDLINVADSPLARARMSAVAMAHLIRRDAGVDVLLHVSCRDRNAIGLQSELLGAHTLGVLNVLAVTGDPATVGDYPFAKGVFELDSIGLSRMVTQLNCGKDLTGRDLEEPTNFLLGVAVNPTSPNVDLEYDRFRQKIDAGAQFAFTQPLFDPKTLDVFLNRVASFCKIPIFVGIMPLRSSKHAEFIHNEIPDMFVPSDIRERMRNAGTEGAKVGVEIAQEFLLATKPMVQGTYLMPPFNKFDMAIEVMKVLESAS